MTTVSVCLSDEQARALKALAAAMDESLSGVVRSAADDYIGKHRAKRASQRSRGRATDHAWEVFDLFTQ